MRTNAYETALSLSDDDLVIRVDALASSAREVTAELIAHLAALELRPSLYAGRGYGSLYDYCTRALRLSEDAACDRIRAARICRDFPALLDLLGSGSVSLTTIRLLQPHLTPENQEAVLLRATHRSRKQILALVAELAPQPDVAASVRKLPGPALPDPEVEPPSLPWETAPAHRELELAAATPGAGDVAPRSAALAVPGMPWVFPGPGLFDGEAPVPAATAQDTPITSPIASPASARAVVRASAPGRYRVQFTIGEETHEKLERLQALMRREIPSGDVAVIFEQAVELMLMKVERAKLGAKAKARPSVAGESVRTSQRRSRGAGVADSVYGNRIRVETDSHVAGEVTNDETSGSSSGPCGSRASGPIARPAPSRHIPNTVKRAVWQRDGSRCAFVSGAGQRCAERAYLELHHIHPYALDGPPTVENISLRCRRHNTYEAELVFGARREADP
jgi:hypothetical protein